LGSWNFGNYSNARCVDELPPLFQQAFDPAARQGMIDELVAITQDENAYIPLYTQPLIWAVKDNIDVRMADNFMALGHGELIRLEKQ
jgi:peptide/nickel transport system substrate-binding protein